MVTRQAREANVPRILITDPIAQEGIDLLRYGLPEAQIDIRLDLSPEQLLALIGSYSVLIVRSQTRVTVELLAKAAHLQIIGRAGSGLDNIDLNAAIRHSVLVVHAPRGTTIAVSEQTIVLLLALARHLPAANRSLKAGRWDKRRLVGVELHQKVLGIIGLGRVGTEVAHMAQAFGMRVIASDPLVSPRRAQQVGVTLHSKEEVLQRADFVTLHATLTDGQSETRRLLEPRKVTAIRFLLEESGPSRIVLDNASLIRHACFSLGKASSVLASPASDSGFLFACLLLLHPEANRGSWFGSMLADSCVLV